jgi:hypothetical protein
MATHMTGRNKDGSTFPLSTVRFDCSMVRLKPDPTIDQAVEKRGSPAGAAQAW